ncbi:calmodulin-like isoform X2 [Pecten maximus]|uniref:calmodulin-like isoform X2 n=1 Tax=Pecten maximus TaxID=6579 RepID=UPI001458DEAE|nr:calmodulin-like isoform X2 [Pecten maximus]
MADDFTEEQLAEYREAFDMFDQDGSGSITIKEMITVMQELGQGTSEEELKAELEAMDTNNDGTIEFHEFLATLKKMSEPEMTPEEEELKKCFQLFDKNKQGYLTIEELRHILQDLGNDSFTDKDFEKLIKEGEIQVEGRLTYKKFVEMMIGPP